MVSKPVFQICCWLGKARGIRREKLKTEPPLSSMPGAELVPLQVPKMLQIPMIIASSSMMTLQAIKAPLPAQRQAGSPSRMAAPNSNFGDAEKGGLDGGAPTDQTTNVNSGCQNCPFGGGDLSGGVLHCFTDQKKTVFCFQYTIPPTNLYPLVI